MTSSLAQWLSLVWTTTSEHRQVVVTGGSYESMRAEALDALAAAGVQTQGIVADIAPVSGAPRRGVRQAVVVSLAPASELSAQVQTDVTVGVIPGGKKAVSWAPVTLGFAFATSAPARVAPTRAAESAIRKP